MRISLHSRLACFTVLSLGGFLPGFARAETPHEKAEPLEPIEVRGTRPPLLHLRLELPPHLLTARYAAAAVADANYIYVIGGANSGFVNLDDIERFDVRTGKSEHWGHLHLARRLHSAVLVGRDIYVLGGYVTPVDRTSNRSAFTESVEIINLDTGQSRPGPDMPVPKGQFACTELGGQIYVIGGVLEHRGGLRTQATTNSMEMLDLATGRWRTGLTMPTPRQGVGVAVGAFIMVAGGQRGLAPVANVEVYVPSDQLWRQLPPLLQPVSMHSAVFLGHHVFLFARTGTIAYELYKKQSQFYPFDFNPARLTAAAVCEGRIYVLGGSRSTEDPAEDYNDVNPEGLPGPGEHGERTPAAAVAGRADPSASAEAISDIQVFTVTPDSH